MRRLRTAVRFLVLGFVLSGAAAPPSFQELEESLTCQCGCGLTVHSCNHLQCGSALPLRDEIRQQMAAGKSKEEVVAYFTDKYGEKILSSPTGQGFNITAWVMPFVLLGIGGVFVAVAVLRWTRRAPQPEQAGKAPPAASSEYQEILDRELDRFDG